VLADTMASGYNVFAGTWLEGSGPAEVELVVIDWLRRIVGMPETVGGLFVSGGSVANLTALVVAREVKLSGQIDGAVAYCSDQTHSSIERALRVIGFSNEQLRKLGSDEDFRLPVGELSRAVEADRLAGKNPFLVVANAGATNTGAVDPLAELVAFCGEQGLWLHVDGAIGAAAMLSQHERQRLEGIERSDSLSLDPHKWWFQPYETGCLLVRDARRLKDCFHILPEYLKDLSPEEEEVNFYDLGIQLTRSFRALKLWASLKVFGLASFRKAVERGLQTAIQAEERLRRSPVLEVVTPAQMGIVTFRVAAAGLSGQAAESIHEKIVSEMIADGLAMVSSTVLKGRTALHMSTINPRTTIPDVDRTIDKIESIAVRLAESAGPGVAR
jgi:glutamate/tyrosine decarboxylase-like PLP-dependent enzyme